jgi:hypothetical protein
MGSKIPTFGSPRMNTAHASAERFLRSPMVETIDCGGDGGGERNRTDDLLLAKQALSQLSYTPGRRAEEMVGQGGFEPPTSRLSSARSNQLSY